MKKRTLFFTMVLHPLEGWMRAGNAYPTRAAAAEWLPIVKGRWHTRAKVAQLTVMVDAKGNVDERSRRVLLDKFNLIAGREAENA